MPYCDTIPENLKTPIKKIAGNILTYQDNGVLYLHDFYTKANAYKKNITEQQATILSEAVLEAQRIYFKESGGKALIVKGTPITASNNKHSGSYFKKKNMDLELKRNAKPTPKATKPKPEPKKATETKQTAKPKTKLGELKQAPWFSWLANNLKPWKLSDNERQEFRFFINKFPPTNNINPVNDVFRGKDEEGHFEGINSVEDVDTFIDSLNMNHKNNNEYYDKNGNKYNYTDEKSTVEKPDIEWKRKDKTDDTEQEFGGQSFFQKYGFVNFFRFKKSSDAVYALSEIIASNWTGQNTDNIHNNIVELIRTLNTGGLLDRFQAATTNYIMGKTLNTNILQSLAVPTDEYTKDNPRTNRKSKTTLEYGKVYQLPNIITDTMFSLLPHIVDDIAKSKKEQAKRDKEDGQDIDLSDPIYSGAFLEDVAMRVGYETLNALGISPVIYKTVDGKKNKR